MSNLNQLVKKIKTVESTVKVTNCLRIISSNKFIIYRDLHKKSKLYLRGVYRLFYEFFMSPDHSIYETNKKLIKNPNGPHLWVCIGSDIGMCGDFNNKIASYLLEQVREKDHVIVLGVKLFSMLKSKLDKNTHEFINSEINSGKMALDIEKICKKILNTFMLKSCGKLTIVYLKSKQDAVIEKLNVLPFTNNYFSYTKNVFVQKHAYEVNYPQVIFNLFPKYLEALLGGAIIKSKINEHTVRRDLMYTATKNAETLLDEYKILYNKLRQSIITQEISEIIAATKVAK